MHDIPVTTASEQEYAHLIEELNDIFFWDEVGTENPHDFMTLLPKLYKAQYKPWEHNYVVREGDRIKASVGLYESNLKVGEYTLQCGGIGNVGVSRDARSKGYMKAALNAALDAMVKHGCDYGVLGGQRQRYNYFGFEAGGWRYNFHLSRANLRHCYGKDAVSAMQTVPLKGADKALLLKAKALIDRFPIHFVHEDDMMEDLLCNWQSTPYAVLDGERLAGIFAIDRDGRNFSVFHADTYEDTKDVLLCAFAVLDPEVRFADLSTAPYDKQTTRFLFEMANGVEETYSAMFTILNYQKVIQALLKAKAAMMPLRYGSLVLKIDGYCGTEQLKITVSDTVVVEPTTEKPDLTLSHLKAIRFLTGFTAPEREVLAGTPAADWFPLPLYEYGYDAV